MNPCCVPSKQRAVAIATSRKLTVDRKRASQGSTEGMVRLDGGAFWMGTDYAAGFPLDGEGPVRRVTLDPFHIDTHTVTNDEFAEFISKTGYVTESERFGWSYVFQGHLKDRPELIDQRVPGVQWWCKVNGADWRHPEGPDTGIGARPHHPAVQVSWNDAAAYAGWAGKRLPAEAEWEYAARGGAEQKLFPWGDELTPGGKHLCNVWQGKFPEVDEAEDGYSAPSPVDAFPANGYGLFAVAGNTWEWCEDWFDAAYHVTASRSNPVGPPEGAAKLMKGGSYLCHESYCNRYRVAARTSNTPDSATTNIGFRCVRDI